MKSGSQSLRIISTMEVDAERRAALRALLRSPFLRASGETSELYVLVRRHAEWLKHWFATFPKWNLHIEGELARLRKTSDDPSDDTRPAVDQVSGATFTKQRYALLCLALASLEQLDRQTTLGQLAETIMELLSVDQDLQASGLRFDSRNYDQRRDLVHAVRFLVSCGVLRKIDGDERHSDNHDSQDALYDINRHVLAELFQGTHSPSVVETTVEMTASHAIGQQARSPSERAAMLNDDPIPASEESRRQWIRSRLVRTLLDDPVLYFHDLNDEERHFLEKYRGSLLREICDATGLIAEVRREGIALVDASGDLTDLKLPDPGAENHLSLLLVRWFADRFKARKGETISTAEVEVRVRELIHAHRSEWHKDIREAGTEMRMSEDALTRIRALRLIQVSPDGITPLPATCRYSAVDQL